MKTFSALIGAFVVFFSISANAEIPGTIWLGTSADVYRNGKLLCSSDTKNDPVYTDDSGYAELHKGGQGWIWPLFAGGCANHVGSRLKLQIVGSEVKDGFGQTVGNISSTELRASNFTAGDRAIKSLRFSILNDGTAEVDMIFEYLSHPGKLQFTAKYSFYRNEH